MQMKSIDLNADIAEGAGHDDGILPLVSSVNIACGAHAGDERTMRHTIANAARLGVAVGAHPGYPDRENFGRKPLAMSTSSLCESIHRQLDLFLEICKDTHIAPHHVKLHGALYHQANEDAVLAEALAATICRSMPGTMLYVPPHGEMRTAAWMAGLHPVIEGFADRRYQDNASLVPRHESHAMLSGQEEATAQALDIAIHNRVQTTSHRWIPFPVDSICIHGDGPAPALLLEAIRQELEEQGAIILPP